MLIAFPVKSSEKIILKYPTKKTNPEHVKQISKAKKIKNLFQKCNFVFECILFFVLRQEYRLSPNTEMFPRKFVNQA